MAFPSGFPFDHPEKGDDIVYLVNLGQCHISEAAVYFGSPYNIKTQIHVDHYIYWNPEVNPISALKKGWSSSPLPPLNLKSEIISSRSLCKLQNNRLLDQSINIYGVTSLGQKSCQAVWIQRWQSTVFCHPREHILLSGSGHLRRWAQFTISGSQGPCAKARRRVPLSVRGFSVKVLESFPEGVGP